MFMTKIYPLKLIAPPEFPIHYFYQKKLAFYFSEDISGLSPVWRPRLC